MVGTRRCIVYLEYSDVDRRRAAQGTACTRVAKIAGRYRDARRAIEVCCGGEGQSIERRIQIRHGTRDTHGAHSVSARNKGKAAHLCQHKDAVAGSERK